jgi:hypothetical protein
MGQLRGTHLLLTTMLMANFGTVLHITTTMVSKGRCSLAGIAPQSLRLRVARAIMQFCLKCDFPNLSVGAPNYGISMYSIDSNMWVKVPSMYLVVPAARWL